MAPRLVHAFEVLHQPCMAEELAGHGRLFELLRVQETEGDSWRLNGAPGQVGKLRSCGFSPVIKPRGVRPA